MHAPLHMRAHHKLNQTAARFFFFFNFLLFVFIKRQKRYEAQGNSYLYE